MIFDNIDIHSIAYYSLNYRKASNNPFVHLEDLKQELSLQVLEMDKKKLIDLYNSGNLERYLFKAAFLTYQSKTGQFNIKYRQQNYIQLLEDHHSKEFISVFGTSNMDEYDDYREDIPFKKHLDKIKSKVEVLSNEDNITVEQIYEDCELTEIERLWIDTWLENNTYCKIQDKTGISRRHISKRINQIFNKCKTKLT